MTYFHNHSQLDRACVCTQLLRLWGRLCEFAKTVEAKGAIMRSNHHFCKTNYFVLLDYLDVVNQCWIDLKDCLIE